MYNGQLMIYHYNGLHNATEQTERNVFVLKNVNEPTKELFQKQITNALDSIPLGKGYVLVKLNHQYFNCEKDFNNLNLDFVGNETMYHPYMDKFTV